MCRAASKLCQAFAYVWNYIVPCYFTGTRFREAVTVEARAIFYAVSPPVHSEWFLIIEFTDDVTFIS